MAEDKIQRIISSTSDNDEKKINRREVERQRRTQMSVLCASLRSSLPLELIKGKRSVSDLIGEAVNHVQFLKQKINALQIKRDELKEMMVNLSFVKTETVGADHSSALGKCVSINLIPGGVEVAVYGSGFEENSTRLSVLMQILLQEGCDVVSCVSSLVNGRIFHTIKSEVKDLTCLDLARLQHRLDQAILSR
ncbi:transcription factor bHLH118-like isoform X2 [Lotus japonicus]|uniref:transcription factor bHLH118-like isoform X2 n=1 Tax=Lotus japonicus TaxID=34305 RepID=UPI00258FA766|nr:transcription factor bHLH118-like isoform X2 [Lotus japonicus]